MVNDKKEEYEDIIKERDQELNYFKQEINHLNDQKRKLTL